MCPRAAGYPVVTAPARKWPVVATAVASAATVPTSKTKARAGARWSSVRCLGRSQRSCWRVPAFSATRPAPVVNQRTARNCGTEGKVLPPAGSGTSTLRHPPPPRSHHTRPGDALCTLSRVGHKRRLWYRLAPSQPRQRNRPTPLDLTSLSPGRQSSTTTVSRSDMVVTATEHWSKSRPTGSAQMWVGLGQEERCLGSRDCETGSGWR